MLDPLSSLGRLNDSNVVGSFCRLFGEHGALGYGIPPSPGSHVLTEIERLSLVPLVFGLLPARAIRRTRVDERVKPYIHQHLDVLGIPPEELLVDILKSIADQYASTSPVNSLRTGVPVKRKLQIASLRALGHPYRRLLHLQRGRCAICGALFDGRREEQLDHIVPWRLIGDVGDGSNWQVLCFECNVGKGSLLTTLLSAEAWGWLYASQSPINDAPTLETRYIVLAQRRRCEYPECGVGPMTSSLEVKKAVATGLPVVDNLVVACENHR